jgi:hypothetical protein
MKSILFFLIAFIAVSAFLSGLLMIAEPGGSILNLPVSILEPTPFKDFLIPGIILSAVVGGTNLLAVVFNLKQHASRYNWALAGGIMICGWIIAQMILIQAAHWLHFIYLAAGVLIILVAWQLKGKWAV